MYFPAVDSYLPPQILTVLPHDKGCIDPFLLHYPVKLCKLGGLKGGLRIQPLGIPIEHRSKEKPDSQCLQAPRLKAFKPLILRQLIKYLRKQEKGGEHGDQMISALKDRIPVLQVKEGKHEAVYEHHGKDITLHVGYAFFPYAGHKGIYYRSDQYKGHREINCGARCFK